ncbi:sensor histidine kinase [Pedobacter nototheniae]|uniref:sensor histidine kinase n=1 Tax=Pedobacter nototheniae TaxID=2488994 RepID=UPI00292DB27B|nr:histidine kinase [Pedobacter nototheniae]
MKKSHFVYFHIGYWLILWLKELLFGFQTFNVDDLTFSNVIGILTVKLITLIFPLCIFYINFLVLVPKLVRPKKILFYIISIFALFAALAPLHQYIYGYILPKKFGWYSYVYTDKLTFWLSFQTLLFENYVYIFFSIAISYVNEFFETQKKQQELAKEQALTELAYLKSQINPHFLFNTLNDIYALTYQQAKQAPEAVLKLSALLRYMLKESNDRFALIEKEISYLRNVIELFEIGQKGMANVKLEITGTMAQQQIAPLILINFIENAFKHGVTNDPQNPIYIMVAINPNHLDFKVVNKKNNDQKDKTSGIGLANVQRRLSLIYPNRHKLQIIDENDTFTVTLKLDWI